MNRCHVCAAPAVNADAALCLKCSERADRGDVWYDPQWGWMETMASNLRRLFSEQATSETDSTT